MASSTSSRASRASGRVGVEVVHEAAAAGRLFDEERDLSRAQAVEARLAAGIGERPNEAGLLERLRDRRRRRSLDDADRERDPAAGRGTRSRGRAP